MQGVIFPLLGNGAMRVNHHEHHEREQEHNRTGNGNAIEVLLDNARARLRRVHGAGNGIGNTRALARVHENEDDQTDAREHQQNQEYDYQRIQRFTLPSSVCLCTQVVQYNGSHLGQQALSRHFRRRLKTDQSEQGRRDVGQTPLLARETVLFPRGVHQQ